MRAWLRFYAELHEHLPGGREIAYAFDRARSLREAVGELGVAAERIDLALADGRPVDLEWRLEDGARVSLYPVFETFDVTRVRPGPALRSPRFVADVHLGRLAGYLRMLGFDTYWRDDYDDDELERVSVSERRVLLTRDRALSQRPALTHVHRVEAKPPREQLAEVVRRFDLGSSAAPFTRCMRCNVLLHDADPAHLPVSAPEWVRARGGPVRTCSQCLRAYWEGSHHRRMTDLIADVLR